MKYFRKIIKQKQINEIFNLNFNKEEFIEIGNITSYDPHIVIPLVNLIAEKSDKLIQLDKEANKRATDYSRFFLSNRPPTYEEYANLFNSKIEESEFPNYMIFNLIRREKGGINFDKQRQYYLMNYTYCQEDYVKLLLDEGYEPILKYFFSDWVNLKSMIGLDKLAAHTFLCASTGRGKSTLLVSFLWKMLQTLNQNKVGFVIIDPHGEIAEQIKALKIHQENPERFFYYDADFADNYSSSLNPFEVTSSNSREVNFQGEQILSIFIDALDNDSSNKLSSLMVSCLEKAIYFLLKKGNSTMKDLVKLLDCDPELIAEAYSFDNYFNEDYIRHSNKTRTSLKGRVERFLNSPILKNNLTTKSLFDLEKLINGNKILVFNLSKVPEHSQSILGKILITRIRSICRKRPKGTDNRTFLFLDECQLFSNKSYSKILSEMRGFGLSLLLCCQYPKQLGNELEGVINNCAVKIAASNKIEKIKEVVELPMNATLSNWEFFIEVGSQKVTKFKAPDFLFTHRDEIFASKEEVEKLDKLMLQKYYRRIDDETEIESSQNISPNQSDTPRPLFDLNIEEDED